jgi:D-alanyl-D-alanine carboxypeptidase
VDAPQVSEMLATLCTDQHVYGASAAVRRPGQPDVLAAAGVDGRNPDSPMPTSGKFRIGSVTKTFTSAAVLGLVDRGDLALDTTIERWLPSYPHAAQITIRSLLDHTAGTADQIFDDQRAYVADLLADLEREYTPAELAEVMAALPPHDVPGATYRYSNTDFNLLGLILEQVTGTPFATLLAERFTGPMHLDATSYDIGIPDGLVHGWLALDPDGELGTTLERDLDVLDFPNAAMFSLAYAAGGMTSTLSDLLTWIESLYGGDVLSPAMRAQLLASPEHDEPFGGTCGLGVFGYGVRGRDGRWTAYGHTGNMIGSSSFVAFFPDSGTTVVLHANVLEVPAAATIDLAFALEALA